MIDALVLTAAAASIPDRTSKSGYRGSEGWVSIVVQAWIVASTKTVESPVNQNRVRFPGGAIALRLRPRPFAAARNPCLDGRDLALAQLADRGEGVAIAASRPHHFLCKPSSRSTLALFVTM